MKNKQSQENMTEVTVSAPAAPSTERNVTVRTKVRDTVQLEKPKRRIPILAAVGLIVITFFAMMLISSFTLLNEYTLELGEMRDELNTLKQTENKLSVELNKKNDLLKIEEYAQGKLGMVSEEAINSEYIEGDVSDRIEVYHDEEDAEGLIATVMNAIGQNLVSAWNSLQKSE